MKSPFKPKISKEQKAEQARFKAFVRDVLYPKMVEQAENAYQIIQFMKAVQISFSHNTELRMAKLKKEIDEGRFGDLEVKALEGKYSKQEQAIIDALADEKVETVNRLISRWQPIMDQVIREELLKRPASSLDIKWE